MNKENEQQSNFPTFTPLEDIVETQANEEDNSGAPIIEPSKEEEIVLKKEGEGDVPKGPAFDPLNEGVTVASTDDEEEISREDAIDTFNKAVALGVFQVPEDFEYDGSEEKTEEVYKYTMQMQEQKAKDALFEKIADPYIQYLIDYGMEAGQFADVKGLGASLKEFTNYSNVDLSDEKQATAVVRKHLESLGNSSKIIDRVIKDAVENDELEDLGADAKDYFIKKTEQDILNRRQADAQAAADQRKYQKQYEDKFMATLKEKELRAEDKQGILSAFNDVELQNGDTMPEYQYKLEMIKQEPSDFIELLKILGSYKAGEGFNLDTADKVKTEKIKSIYTTLNGKKQTIIKSTGTQGNERQRFIPTYVDRSTII